jgi:hypothetical protein
MFFCILTYEHVKTILLTYFVQVSNQCRHVNDKKIKGEVGGRKKPV